MHSFKLTVTFSTGLEANRYRFLVKTEDKINALSILIDYLKENNFKTWNITNIEMEILSDHPDIVELRF